MAGFLCKQVEPYKYEFDTATTVGSTDVGQVRFNNVTLASITTMFVNLLDSDGINRRDWLDSFYTDTVAGRDLLTMTYKSYTTVTISSIATSGVVTTTPGHSLSVGDTISLGGSDSTPVINGDWVVISVPSASTFVAQTGITVTTVGTTGTFVEYGKYTFSDVVFQINGTSVAEADGIATISVGHLSGTLPADATDVTLSFNKAGVVSYKFWYGNCTRVQEGLGLCSSVNGAWVPAVTVCKEEL